MKLIKSLEGKLGEHNGTKSSLRSKENFMAGKANDKFIENEIERQRRSLVEENEILKKRLRAIETITNSSSSQK